MSLKPGQALGNYRILSQIGVGGMGMVYLAEHPLIGKKVALKVIHQDLARNREVVARFFREAKAVNTIGNEHIVEINDFGQTDNGEHFLIMEYLEGKTLADELSGAGALPTARAAHISAQIAAGLGAAHAVGIVHRDLKPDNVMLIQKLGDRDFVKLLDFGLAKILADSSVQQLTAQGVVLGTPQYMSPEACESKQNIDARADIYSLGVLMFQMMTGQLPFAGPAMGEILVKHVTCAPPPPRGINPDIPPAIEQVVLRCLAKAPDSRFPTMGQLRDALLDPDRYLASSPPVMPSSSLAGSPASDGFVPGNRPGAPARPADERRTVIGKRTGAMPSQAIQTPPSQKRTRFLDGGAPPPPMATPPPAAPPIDAAVSGPEARTAFMDAVSQPGLRPPAMPDMPQPQPAKNSTMVIGTPHGYSNAPPRKRWPLVVALLAILAVGSVAITVLLWSDGRGSVASARAADDSDSVTTAAAAANSPSDSDDEAEVDDVSDEPSPATQTAATQEPPALAKITLTSNPAGATVVDEQENKLGVTPTVIELPSDGASRVLELRHPKAKTRKKTITVSGDAAVTVQMELLEGGNALPPDADDPGASADPTTPSRARTERKRTRKRDRKPGNRTKQSKAGGDDVIAPDFD